MCRRHPLQDHGKREQQIKREAEAKGIQCLSQLQTWLFTNYVSCCHSYEGVTSQLSRSYNEIIQAQIEKLKNESRGLAEDENEKFRQSLQDGREKNMIEMGKKRQKVGSTNSGLRPDVAALLVSSDSENEGDSDSDIQSNSSKSTTSGSSVISTTRTKRSHKESKKRKRKEKEKREKKSRKSKKSKKEKKGKKEKRLDKDDKKQK